MIISAARRATAIVGGIMGGVVSNMYKISCSGQFFLDLRFHKSRCQAIAPDAFGTLGAIKFTAALTKPMALLTVMPGDADFVKYDGGGDWIS